MVISEVSNAIPDGQSLALMASHWHQVGTLLAQKVEDPNILGKMQSSFQNFIESGQVWALGIGFVLGYLFRNFTAY